MKYLLLQCKKYLSEPTTLSDPSRLQRSILSSLASPQYNFCALWSRVSPLGIRMWVVTIDSIRMPLRRERWIDGASAFQLVQ